MEEGKIRVTVPPLLLAGTCKKRNTGKQFQKSWRNREM